MNMPSSARGARSSDLLACKDRNKYVGVSCARFPTYKLAPGLGGLRHGGVVCGGNPSRAQTGYRGLLPSWVPRGGSAVPVTCGGPLSPTKGIPRFLPASPFRPPVLFCLSCAFALPCLLCLSLSPPFPLFTSFSSRSASLSLQPSLYPCNCSSPLT
jgi:hypothetical protein